MYIVIFSSLLALLFTYLESKGQMRNGMKTGFFLVTFLGAIHYDYGNDYMSYLNLYNEVTNYNFDLKGILEKDNYKEPGWVLLCWFFKYIGGFFMMVAILNVIQNCIVYQFIKKYVERQWWPLSIFIYLFGTSFYLMSFSMLRQEFVIIVFLGLWSLIVKRKWWLPLITLYLCSHIHSSALVLIPFSFWGYLSVKKSKIIALIYALLLFTLWIFQDVLNDIFQFVLEMDEVFLSYADTYGTSKNERLHLGLGFAIYFIPFILSIAFLVSKQNKNSVQMKQLVALSAISFLVTPFGQIIQLVGRLSMYFSIYNLGTVPLIYGNIKNNIFKRVLLSLYIFVVLYDYFLFFRSPVWIDKYTHFHTIFSQLF